MLHESLIIALVPLDSPNQSRSLLCMISTNHFVLVTLYIHNRFVCSDVITILLLLPLSPECHRDQKSKGKLFAVNMSRVELRQSENLNRLFREN